ncbi:DUF1127 domain-containing protein [Bradyrhizobium sp. 83012]|uniref:DUF1127 domain-containing protein n=1 Tax=Bradyrhizobium aeschynomenes TaxID=2734909 RepID=A0ABX2C8W2_9BRAD|nr:DUF1127 domain-containing protein [Bradyrhizobium aeschynomenes]NPU63950.1 DUF1127 domain-containing protein [Bradyrhizobium aeschynomenes]
MQSTTDDPSLSAIGTRGFRGVAHGPRIFERGRDRSARRPASPKPGGNVYYLSHVVADPARAEPESKSLLRLWWARWRERRRFARELPWLADEVLEDYGLTRDEARRLCRRPLWRA